MANRNNLFRRIRLVYKRSSILTKVVVLCAIVLSTATLLTLRWSLLDTQAQAEVLKSQAAQLEQENNRLEAYIADLGSVDSVERIAREELGLVDPDSVIFLPEN